MSHLSRIRTALALIAILALAGSAGMVCPIQPPWSRSYSSTFEWTTTPEVRVTMRSTADWARIMFDDLNGTNRNGIRFKQVLGYGWQAGNDSNDQIDVGTDVTWTDVLYQETVNRTGDIVAFFKQREDFDYTEMYADIIFEVDANRAQAYLYLMIAGQGTTAFQITNRKTQTVVWKDTISGNGHTQHVRRYVTVKAFFLEGRIESNLVLVMAALTVLVVVLLNPIRIAWRRSSDSGGHRGGH